MTKRVLVIALVLLIGGSVAGAGFYYMDYFGTQNNRLSLSGTVEVEEVDLSFRVAEQVETVRVEEGDRVKKGQVLAVLDRSIFKSKVKQAQTQLKTAQAELKYAKKQRNRIKRLHTKELASKEQLDRARRNYERAVQARNKARAALEQARIRLRRTRLKSTISGFVISDNLDEGEYAAPGVPVFTLADLHDVWVRAYVNETKLGDVKRGMAVSIKTDSFEKPFEGEISYISDEAEFTPRTVRTREQRVKLMYRIKITVKYPHRKLKPGMPVDAIVQL